MVAMATADANDTSLQPRTTLPGQWERVVAVLLAAVLSLVVFGCDGAGLEPDTPPDAIEASRPTEVPTEAMLVISERTLGSLGKDSPEESRLFAVECVNNLLAIVTSRVRVYAELPCDRALPPDKVQDFLGDPVIVRIRIFGREDNKLFFQSQTAGSVEFTTGRVWTAPP
jgi:hypothetical protein